MTEHMKEPWCVEFNKNSMDYEEIIEIWSSDAKYPITEVPIMFLGGKEEAEAMAIFRRIVACVNACAGFSEEELVEVAAHGGFSDQTRYAFKVTEQRDALLSALATLRAKFISGNDVPVERSVIKASEWAPVEAAIASIEGGA